MQTDFPLSYSALVSAVRIPLPSSSHIGKTWSERLTGLSSGRNRSSREMDMPCATFAIWLAHDVTVMIDRQNTMGDVWLSDLLLRKLKAITREYDISQKLLPLWLFYWLGSESRGTEYRTTLQAYSEPSHHNYVSMMFLANYRLLESTPFVIICIIDQWCLTRMQDHHFVCQDEFLQLRPWSPVLSF